MASLGYRSREEIQWEAEQFLATHHPSGEIPIPIEEIVEFDLGIEIVPVRGLQERFGIDGSISLDLAEIVVDEWSMENRIPRYRFTLAHEIGHFVLHDEFIRGLSIDSTDDWKVEIQRTSRKDYSSMEFQAHEFAGCVLVPRDPLLDAFDDALEHASARGLDVRELGDYGLRHVAGWIAPRFEVSRQVIEIRLKREGIWQSE